jgi:hypothetical protein
LTALRRRRKVFGSSLLTTKTFMTTHARCATAPHIAVVLLGGAVAHLACVVMNVFVVSRLLPKTFLQRSSEAAC